MPTYAIGDIQGCYAELQDLLDRINFDNRNDRLWITGDIVNRGPDSLQALRCAKDLDAITVLGNHECHLIAIAAGVARQKNKDTLDDVLNAGDRDDLLSWVRRLPLLHRDDESGFTMIHAGLPPQWDMQQAIEMAREVETVIRGEKVHAFLANMYGNYPDIWDETLEGMDRWRFITNVFTRMRYCNDEGRMNLEDKGPPGSQAKSFHPWFKISSRRTRRERIIFGHWASLHHGNLKNLESDNVYPLDTGCVWGRELTAMRLEDQRYFSVPSRQQPVNAHA